MKKLIIFILSFIFISSASVIGYKLYSDRVADNWLYSELNQVKENNPMYGDSSVLKLKYVHDEILRRVSYDSEAAEAVAGLQYMKVPDKYETSYSAAGAWKTGKGTCAAFADLYVDLGSRYGLEIEKVVGYLNGTPHAWNSVEIGNLTYCVDLTQNSLMNPPYLVFLTPAEDLEDEYVPDEGWEPGDRSYDNWKHITAYDVDSAILIARKLAERKTSTISFKLAYDYTTADVNQILKTVQQYKTGKVLKYDIFAKVLHIVEED